MYKDDLGYRVMFQRKYVCGYSRKKLAKLTGIDIEDIRMIENGSLKNPQPQLILNIAGALGLSKRKQRMNFYIIWIGEQLTIKVFFF